MVRNKKHCTGSEEPALGCVVEHGAGVFSSWLRRVRHMLLRDSGVNVPCGDCTGCCTASKFIHISPDEVATIALIPANYLAAAPQSLVGHVVMGYDEQGRCPMFKDGYCTIYHNRPRTCRNFDCRVFAAANVLPAGKKTPIQAQVALWRFDYPTEADRQLQKSIRDVASFIKRKPHCFPGGRVPDDAGQRAILAIKASAVFLPHHAMTARPDAEKADAIVDAVRWFDDKRGSCS